MYIPFKLRWWLATHLPGGSRPGEAGNICCKTSAQKSGAQRALNTNLRTSDHQAAWQFMDFLMLWIFQLFSCSTMRHRSCHLSMLNMLTCTFADQSWKVPPTHPSHPPLSWHSCHDTSGLCPNQSHKMPQARWFSVRKLKVLLYDYCLVFSRSVTDSTI